jgi:hypothetical protein
MQTEKLHPNLQRYLDGSWLRHPLVVMHSPVPKEANYFYNLKKSEIAAAIREQDWEGFVALHERPYRALALKTLLKKRAASFSQLWPVIGSVWCDTEFPNNETDFWRRIWGSADPLKRSAMDPDDLAKFDQLPEEVTVWRGVDCEEATEGMSWTLERDVGVYFASRFRPSTPILAHGRAKKENIAAYFNTRKEAEVIILPEHVLKMYWQEL